MRQSRSLILALLAFLSFFSLSLAASSTSFCKCTCFGNSTIIQLDGKPPSSSSTSPSTGNPDGLKARGTCNDCTRSFCLSYNLPICKGAKEEDVSTPCFRRDSGKDEAVVFIFIIATTGLLIYAAIQPWVDRWTESIRERRSYIPVSDPRVDE